MRKHLPVAILALALIGCQTAAPAAEPTAALPPAVSVPTAPQPIKSFDRPYHPMQKS